MLDTSNCSGHLAGVREAAEKLGRGAVESLTEKLAYLDGYANGLGCLYEKEGTRCRLFFDHAPLSFQFVMEHGDGKGGWVRWFNGGLIYQGPGVPGDGSFPSLTVSLSDNGNPHWGIHT